MLGSPLVSGPLQAFREAGSEGSSPLDQVDDDHDDRDHQQQVDQPAGDVEGEEPESPENEQNDRNGQKHGSLLALGVVGRLGQPATATAADSARPGPSGVQWARDSGSPAGRRGTPGRGLQWGRAKAAAGLAPSVSKGGRHAWQD